MPGTKIDPEDGFDPHHWSARLAKGTAGLSRDQKRRALAAYFGLYTFVDDQIGRDLNALEASGLGGTNFGLTLRARLLGDEVARRTRLLLEYDPVSSFDVGAPDKAGEAATRPLRRFASDGLSACREAAIRIGRERLGIENG